MNRADGRPCNALRPVSMQTDFLKNAVGSCLIACGNTRVLCTASVSEDVPPFLRGTGKGWLTAEYAMLPASTNTRKKRDMLKQDGRGVEIQRLIGRSLRQAIDLAQLGERTITIDCDVLDADGGTRTASITGGFVALVCAVDKLIAAGQLDVSPITHQVAAVSVGLVSDAPCLDLCYREDSAAQADVNIVMTDDGGMVECQGTGEGRSFSRAELDQLLTLAEHGIATLQQAQRDALGARARWIEARLPRLILASGSPHKLREMREMLAGRYHVIPMADLDITEDIPENGATFAENARIKAEYVLQKTGCAVLADDSGLMVDALNGAPGVYSARFAGAHGDTAANNALLVEKLRDVPAPRTARFVCAVALLRPDKPALVVEGACPGEIVLTPRGADGFGYDPYFEYKGRTFAEMDAAEKNRVSHRARALSALLDALRAEDSGCGC